MSTPFTASLRSRPDVLRLGTAGERVITVRVQVPEVWDTIRVDLPPDTPVSTLKERALQLLVSETEFPEDYLIKLSGWEVLNENVSIEEAGAKPGSIFLLTGRRRRPVR